MDSNGNAFAFVEQTQPSLSETFKEIRHDIVFEVELLPQILRLF